MSIKDIWHPWFKLQNPKPISLLKINVKPMNDFLFKNLKILLNFIDELINLRY